MKQVSSQEFFAVIGGSNVHPCIRRTSWPYTTDWELQAGIGTTIGMTEDRLIPGSALTETLYFLP